MSVSSATTYVTAPNTYDSVIVSGTFTEANPSAAVTVSINWGDGAAPTAWTLPVGAYAFSAPHAYELSDPSNPASRYNIGVTISDAAGNSSFAQTSVAIANPAPELPRRDYRFHLQVSMNTARSRRAERS